MQRRGAGMWLAMVLLLPMAARAQSSVVRDDADVTRVGDGRLLYRESHYLPRDAPGERWVLYRCPDGTAFARKHVTASTQVMAPDFRFEDGRDGFREGVAGGPGARVVYSGNGAIVSHPLKVPADSVIDAGFDEAVRARWDDLLRGEPVALHFLVPSRRQFYPVRLQRVAGAGTDPGLVSLRMTLATWFGFAVPDLTLVYAASDRRLRVFRGTGNVRDARGRYPQVRIVFAPGKGAALPGEYARIQRQPLAGRCPF